MVQLLAIKPGRLKPADRKRLAAADIVVIELDDPDDLKLVRVEGSELAASELAWAALAAIDDHGLSTTHHALAKNLRAIVTRNLKRAAACHNDGEEV